MNTNLKTWHERLRYARLLRGYRNHADFARAIGVSPPAAHGWESGKTQVLKGPNLVRVCQKLQISEVWLLEGKGEMDLPDAASQNTKPDHCTNAICPTALSEKTRRILALLNDITESQVDELVSDLETIRARNLSLYAELSAKRVPAPAPAPAPAHH